MSYSVVEFSSSSGNEGHECGYCQGQTSSLNHGMWAHKLRVQDYQALIDRGWRRSGKYLYKPVMARTCCPQYTIRCKATQFRPTKSNKKVIKRFRNYITHGVGGSSSAKSTEPDDDQSGPLTPNSGAGDVHLTGQCHDTLEKRLKLKSSEDTNIKVTSHPEIQAAVTFSTKSPNTVPDLAVPATATTTASTRTKAVPQPCAGPDPSKPLPRKAKDIRRERAHLKAAASGCAKRKLPVFTEKTLADLIEAPFPENSVHKFEIRTVKAQTSHTAFRDSYEESHALYVKYQVAIHKDEPDECTKSLFRKFLCDSSLVYENLPSSRSEHVTLGAFHQQYLLDGKIFMVGVIDILPTCLSSVYLYYNPDYAFLSPGTLSSLFELNFTCQLERSHAEIKDYYMGFYIHSCPKMRYKGKYAPSWLLCPETYCWVDLPKCLPQLNREKYARLSDGDMTSEDEVADLDSTLVLFGQQPMLFRTYLSLACEEKEKQKSQCKKVNLYIKLVGSKLSRSMLLYRHDE